MLTTPVASHARPHPPPAEPVAPYCPLPRRMLSDLRDNELAIGLYLLVARLFLISHAPIPLSRADVLAYDPNIKAGAVKRAFDRLTAGGWLVISTVPGSPKHHYTPTWGVVGGTARPWSLQAPGLGRPRHVEIVRVNRDLLDVGLGRLDPHPRHAAEIARYLVAPALSLVDLGAYALVVTGLGRVTPTLTTLGLVEGNLVCAVPPASALLQHFARRCGIELSEHGRRKLDNLPISSRGVIGRPIGGVIGQLIGAAPEQHQSFSASERLERPQRLRRPTIPGIVRDSSDSLTPPPTPAAPGGGGRPTPPKRRTGPPRPIAALVPDTEATQLLRTISVRPAQQIELAGMTLSMVEAAIADGRARQGIRDLAGWVVYLLRQRRDHGWTPPPPAPRADAPEALGAYFTQLATEQTRARESEKPQERPPATHPPEVASPPAPATPPPAAAHSPSLAELWQNTLTTLRLRLPREMYQACVRQAELVNTTGDTVTIGVTDLRTKDKLQFAYSGPLRLALSDTLGHDVTVRVVLRMPA
jgi:hypothetical protein